MITIAVSVVAMNIGATHAFLFKGIKTTVIDVRIPFTEEKSYEEFFGNIFIHLWMGIYGTTALLAMEIAMEIIVGVIIMAPKLVELEFQKLDKKIKMKQFNEQLQMRLTFRNIIQQIMDIDEYVNSANWLNVPILICNFTFIEIFSYSIEIREIAYYRALLTPPLYTYSVAMAIFSNYAVIIWYNSIDGFCLLSKQFQLGFVAGYGIAIMCYVQLFFVCTSGETFQVCSY